MTGEASKITLRYPGGEDTFVQGPIRIGRAPDNQLVLTDDSLSRHHAEIALARGGWVIRDLQSANGIWISGVRVPSAKLRKGDMVTLGQVALHVVEARQSQAPPNRRVPLLAAGIAFALLLLLLHQSDNATSLLQPIARDSASFVARVPPPPPTLTSEGALKLAERSLKQGLRTGDALVSARHALAWAAKLNGGALPPAGETLQADLDARLDQAFHEGKLAYVRASKLRRRVEAEAAMRVLRETFPFDDPRSVELDRLEASARERR